jgi:predicted Zn-ribbon and HTH transcriptional regulator
MEKGFPFRAEILARFGHAAHRFARSGFVVTPPGILAAREATCRACPEWDSAALNATGRCRKCGCSTWAKLRMATERCPMGKWESISAPSVSPVSSAVNPLPPAP